MTTSHLGNQDQKITLAEPILAIKEKVTSCLKLKNFHVKDFLETCERHVIKVKGLLCGIRAVFLHRHKVHVDVLPTDRKGRI